MTFGQPSGTPATARQLAELQTLLHDAGHSDFRDARGPMGFTQRQAGGKFTRDEAEAFIDQLQQAEHEGAAAAPPARVVQPKPGPPTTAASLSRVPTEQLAAELQRRGWIVIEP